MQQQKPMNSKTYISAKDIAVIGLGAAILFVTQAVMSPLPNIEPVSTLLIAFTLILEKRTIPMIYVFALMEGIFYGFGIWWFYYLYVWTILYIIVRLFRKNQSILIWAVISGLFGLCFGFLCAVSYAIAGGIGAGAAWWISGIPFDIAHGIGNFVMTLVLLQPILYVLKKLRQETLV